MGDSVDLGNLEPNSYKYRAEKAAKREKEKPIVDKSRVVSTKKPLRKKFAETFLSEDINSVGDWLVMDVLIPGIKDVFLDTVQMMLFGEARSRGRRRNGYDDDYYDYRSSYKGRSSKDHRSRRERDREYRRGDHYLSNDRVDCRNIVLRYREDAERIVEECRGRIRNNDSVSVAELLDMLDVAGSYTDNNWGWDDERDIGIRRVTSGYLIDVSEPRYLE